MSHDAQYLILIFAVLLVPKVLLRFRIPTGLTSIFMGIMTASFLGWFNNSPTLEVLATLGITSLFLFAGFEVEIDEMKKNASALLKHILKAILVLIISTIGVFYFLDLSLRASVVLALGLTTPSTGFILSFLDNFDFTDRQKYWIRSKAIAKEVLALVILFFALQSDSAPNLVLSLGAILVIILILPFLFHFFLKKIAPFAPDSEVSFMILMAFLCGVATKELGTYYLIGAFIVGIVAAQFTHFIKTENSEKMLYSMRFFSALFIPFYFFKSGLKIDPSTLNLQSFYIGVTFLIIFVPLRFYSVFISIYFFLRDCWQGRKNISLSLMPTLIFGLVIASILREKFSVSTEIVNGLVFYTIVSSVIPALFLKNVAPEEYDTSILKGASKGS